MYECTIVVRWHDLCNYYSQEAHMMLLSFLGGLTIGFGFYTWRNNHYQGKAEKAVAYVDALKSTISVLTNKIERMEKAGVREDYERQQIDGGLMDGIRYVLKEKLNKLEY
jgi:hypothetical protein